MRRIATSQTIRKTVITLLLCSIAFLMPVWPFFIPIPMGLLLLYLIIFGDRIQPRSTFVKGSSILFVSLWLIYAIGLFWTSNLKYGLDDVVLKLSILLFPLSFLLMPKETVTEQLRRQVSWSFVAGVLALVLLCLSRAVLLYLQSGDAQVFFFTRLAWYSHTTYFAMYVTYSMVVLISSLLTQSTVSKIWVVVQVFILLLFQVVVLMLQSKAGWVVMGVVSLFVFGFYAFQREKRKLTLRYSVIFLVTLVLFINVVPSVTNRVEYATKVLTNTEGIAESQSSTAVRLKVWVVTIEQIQEHLWGGVGTGDIKDDLVPFYDDEELAHAKEKRINPHNQYLQTFLTLGILGIIILLGCLIIPFFYAVDNRDMIYIAFLMIVGINLLFESMLERQLGVYFYAFFNALFFYTTVQKRRI